MVSTSHINYYVVAKCGNYRVEYGNYGVKYGNYRVEYGNYRVKYGNYGVVCGMYFTLRLRVWNSSMLCMECVNNKVSHIIGIFCLTSTILPREY